ncbi:MAG: hypothetical protein IT381_10035 [Deltaproteobacteria bacterium]|nr:hypothetical protein [Deltaproteobacteria bacterium]
MAALPPSIEGFGIKTLVNDEAFYLVIDPRSRFDLGFSMAWTPGRIEVGLPGMQIAPGENLFEYQKRAAVLQLDALDGDVSAALGALGNVIAPMSKWHITVAPERLTLKLTTRPSSGTLFDIVRAMVHLAKKLAPIGSTERDRLAFGARSLTEPEHRIHDLRALLEGYRDDEVTRATLRTCCSDPDASVRLVAAKAAGRDGVPALETIVKAVTVEHRLRTDALDALLPMLAIEAARMTVLSDLALYGDQAMAAVAMDAMDGERAASVVPVMLQLASSSDLVLAPVAVRKLGRHPLAIASFERELCDMLLAPETSEGVVFAIVELLADIGTPECLAPLNAKMRSILFGSKLKQRLKWAIETRKERLKVGDAGSVSVVGATGGEVSREGS